MEVEKRTERKEKAKREIDRKKEERAGKIRKADMQAKDVEVEESHERRGRNEKVEGKEDERAWGWRSKIWKKQEKRKIDKE